MSKVIIDQALRSQLTKLSDQAELCDESGRTLGYFLPPEAYLKFLYAQAKTEVTEEELEEARQDYKKRGGVTTAEILAHLRSLDRQETP